MNKKFFSILTCLSLSLAGCGTSISQEDYNAKVDELESLQERYNAKISELELLQEDYDTKVNELDIAQKNVADLQQKLETTQVEISKLQGGLGDTATSENEIVSKHTDIDMEHKDLNGRGHSDSGREEPSYENVFGYIATGYDEESSLSRSDSFVDTPWMIPTYEKDEQFYIESEAIEHKTEIVVLEQELEHEGYGTYSGYLLVKKLDGDDEFYINVNNFITKPYWSYDDALSAISIGYCIAEYDQISDYHPVDNRNNKVELNEGTKVLLTGKTGLYGGDGPDRDTNSIEAIVFKDWEYGYGGVNVFFNPQDLTIIY